ncbi:mCG1049006, partial [Mus musculus]
SPICPGTGVVIFHVGTTVSFFFFFFFFLIFRDRVSLYIALDVLELFVDQAGLELSLCLPSAGIKGVHHHGSFLFDATMQCCCWTLGPSACLAWLCNHAMS